MNLSIHDWRNFQVRLREGGRSHAKQRTGSDDHTRGPHGYAPMLSAAISSSVSDSACEATNRKDLCRAIARGASARRQPALDPSCTQSA